MRLALIGFACGAAAFLLFHQGAILLAHHHFWLPEAIGLPRALRPPGGGYALRPVPPFGVPQLLSTAFWCGVWGVLLMALLSRFRPPVLLAGFLFGAVVTVLVGFTLVAWLRGSPLWAGGNAMTWIRVAFFNGVWGWGAALLMLPFLRRRHRR
jgi:hypothetical protein